MSYAIVVRGRFLDEPMGDEVVFGNVFEKPIRDSLPWGTSVAVKFMKWVFIIPPSTKNVAMR